MSRRVEGASLTDSDRQFLPFDQLAEELIAEAGVGRVSQRTKVFVAQQCITLTRERKVCVGQSCVNRLPIEVEPASMCAIMAIMRAREPMTIVKRLQST